MTRLLLAACLALFALDAAARASDPAAGTPAACPPHAERTADGKPPQGEAEAEDGRPGTAPPVRARGVSGARPGPRWHSLLPGMIR